MGGCLKFVVEALVTLAALAATFATATVLVLFGKRLGLGLVDRVVTVGVGRVQQALHALRHLISGDYAVPVRVKIHDPGRPVPAPALRNDLLVRQDAILILVERQQCGGGVFDLGSRQRTVLVGVERLHQQAGTWTAVTALASATGAVVLLLGCGLSALALSLLLNA